MKKYQFTYGDVKFKKHIRNSSRSFIKKLAYVTLEFKTEDMSWR